MEAVIQALAITRGGASRMGANRRYWRMIRHDLDRFLAGSRPIRVTIAADHGSSTFDASLRIFAIDLAE